MMKLEMTKQQIMNLQVFLERVEMKGNEALAYIEILRALAEARPIEDKTEEIE